MAHRLLLLVIALGVSTTPVATEQRAAVPMLLLEEAAVAYRKGDIDSARQHLAQLSIGQQMGGAEGLIERERTRVKRRLSSAADAASGARLLRATAALQMEAAAERFRLTLFAGTETIKTRIGIARQLFAAAAELDGSTEPALERWLTAIGTDLMARGSFELAYLVLAAECEGRSEYAPLVLTCGLARETQSVLSHDTATAVRQSRGPLLRLNDARVIRSKNLKAARQLLEHAATLSPDDAEAPMHLGLVLIRTGNVKEATSVLENLTARQDLPVRNRYLASLFLGRAYQRQQRLDDAERAFTAALAAANVQSALLALSHNAQLQGRTADAAALAERAASTTGLDPWWRYYFGQYWLVPGLFDALRWEAQQ